MTGFSKGSAVRLIATVALSAGLTASLMPRAGGASVPAASAAGSQWCAGVHLRFFAGGDAGDAFASIVYRGAEAATADLGPTVDYVFSGWNVQKMTSQLRDAIAAHPDGIAMMGHAGDAAIMPLAAQAHSAGILMEYQNVDVPKVRAVYGGGYVGANLAPQGAALGVQAVNEFHLAKGSFVIVFGAWGQPGRYIREEGTAKALEVAGMKVERITVPPTMAADPNLLTPLVSGAVLRHPETKMIVYPGGQLLGAVPQYMQAIGKKPGQILAIGFDTSPQVIAAFKAGYVQLTADQQPYLQGYMPILSLCMTKKYGFAPMNLDTGNGFIDTSNYQSVAALANAGLR
jgi:simple sugar transport system substrate-binding protein